MTPKEAVDIYKKHVTKRNAIDYIAQTKDFFFFFTERDRSPLRFPSYYVNKNTGEIVNGLAFSPDSARCLKQLADIEVENRQLVPESEYQ